MSTRKAAILLIAVVAIAATAATMALAYFAYTGWQRSHPKPAGPVRITAQPQQLWIEAGEHAQSLNFDFLVENQGSTPLGIDSIEVTAFDRSGQPILRRFIDSNGFAPSIETIPGRVVAAGAKILIFNPFHSFRPDLDLNKLTYKFSLSIPQEAPETTASISIEPKLYVSKTELALPVKGRLLIHDGHDYYSHHRRLNTEHPVARELGITQNFMRFSLDINPTNAGFDVYRADGAKNDDWYAWGQNLYATGDGVVVDASDVAPDNIRGGENYFKPESVKKSPMNFYGNYLVIDHGNGEYSLLGHLQKASLQVKAGDKLVRGQAVAKIGNSGSSNNPHVHYELRTGKDLKADGLPAVFRHYLRHQGARSLSVEAGAVDSGDMLEVP